MNELKSLSDKQLFGDLKKFSGKEQEACVPVLLYLIVVEDRRLFTEEGFSSMFSLCTEGLKYSKGAAHRRIQSARVIREYPID